MGKPLSEKRKRITEKILAMKPGDMFDVADNNERAMAVREGTSRRLKDPKAPTIVSRGCTIIALA